ncbi:hypothetical protein BDN70DRAFT_582080 [Pholiota conissans]|uniref:Uncharacterized protein n=1 Tax=Pholiota conissans TaxID=109636 RepID=A0A9P6D288_9AGAR|nr:hypothetical protein BDN70DRAFT_582080 [Pholiota conissans]
MNERITPVFHQLETLLEENKSLREELRKSNEKYQASKRKLLKEAQLAEERIQEKRETLERFKVSYQKLTKELEESQNSVAEGKKKINALKTKMKGLLRQNRSTGKNDAIDASLVVEEPLSNSKAAIPYKRVAALSSSSRFDSHHHTKRKKDMH